MRSRLITALVPLALAGCAVGPGFRAPSPPVVDAYAPAGTPMETPPGVALGAPVDPSWWRAFGSDQLDALVARGLERSPTLESARRALESADASARAGAGVFFPQAGAAADNAWARPAPQPNTSAGRGATYTLYTLAGEVTYALDLFGGQRRAEEALVAERERQRQAFGAAQIVLEGAIANAAVAKAGYDAEVETLGRIVRLDEEQEAEVRARVQAGLADEAQALQARSAAEVDRQALEAARLRADDALRLLKTLIGAEPGEPAPATPELAAFRPTDTAPVPVPSDLVRRRPDIREAELEMRAANARVGVATAALLPSISITGDYGAASTRLSALAGPAGRFWSVGPSIDVPIFRGGALWNARKGAVADAKKAASDYRATVLAALQQVADQIEAVQADGRIVTAARSADDVARLASDLGEVNASAGSLGELDTVPARLAAERSRLALITAEASRLEDLIGLAVACGGGWREGAPDAGGRAP